ncbi:iron ABC transporter permease [bacterium]|nr:MAG: iron ABC transporter permease [bacterium]RKZ18101.1 MAG: iron ABC transporter permease [bacterium]
MKLRLGLLILFCCVVALLAPAFGRVGIDYPAAISDFIAGRDSADARVLQLRLPRVLLGLVTGGTLAVVGASFQTLLRNGLATPYTLGVSFAGALGAFLALSVSFLQFSLGPFSSVTLLALGFALAQVLLLDRIAHRRSGLSTHELLLAGVTLNFVFAAAIMLVRFLADPLRLRAMDRWMMGGLQVAGFSSLGVLPWLVIPALVFLFARAADLDQLSVGEELASARGVPVERAKRTVLLAGSVAVAALVAITGPIGFVGLLVPHAARRIFGVAHPVLLPACWFLGGAFLVIADALARALNIAGRGSELPVGVLTALAGGPLFLILLLRGRR